jgi:hypothetical protein
MIPRKSSGCTETVTMNLSAFSRYPETIRKPHLPKCQRCTDQLGKWCSLEASILIHLEESRQKALVWMDLSWEWTLMGYFGRRNKIFITAVIPTDIVNTNIFTVSIT